MTQAAFDRGVLSVRGSRTHGHIRTFCRWHHLTHVGFWELASRVDYLWSSRGSRLCCSNFGRRRYWSIEVGLLWVVLNGMKGQILRRREKGIAKGTTDTRDEAGVSHRCFNDRGLIRTNCISKERWPLCPLDLVEIWWSFPSSPTSIRLCDQADH